MVLQFNLTEWEDAGIGIRRKKITREPYVARLVELSDRYSEQDWCRKSHLGFVISGRMSVHFKDRVEEVNEGDGVIIREGEEHRTTVPAGTKTLLVLFDYKL